MLSHCDRLLVVGLQYNKYLIYVQQKKSLSQGLFSWRCASRASGYCTLSVLSFNSALTRINILILSLLVAVVLCHITPFVYDRGYYDGLKISGLLDSLLIIYYLFVGWLGFKSFITSFTYLLGRDWGVELCGARKHGEHVVAVLAAIFNSSLYDGV